MSEIIFYEMYCNTIIHANWRAFR